MKSVTAFKILFALVLVAAAAGGFIYQQERAPESSPVSRGAQVATLAGCFACHGQSEFDPRINFRPRDDNTWRRGGIGLMWEEGLLSPDTVREWVTHGVPERQRARHQQLLVQMPAYGDERHLSPGQIEDVTAWVVAESLRRSYVAPDLEPLDSLAAVALLGEQDLLRRGDALARQTGCYQCNGELGQGAIANPASFKGYIPGFQGDDFRQLTANADPDEIRHWIRHGRGVAIESGLLGGFAKRYFDQQALPMPAYADILDDTQTEVLVQYLRLLNRRGPLDADAIAAFADTLENGDDN